MATNLFDKYGIKDVADVTLFRIERKDETFESQRKITVSAILKSALTKETVYPLDAEGKGETEGYEAYVFKNANILTHFNYDCDDVLGTTGTAVFIDLDSVGQANIATYLKSAETDELPHLFVDENCTITTLVDTASGRNIMNQYAELCLKGFDVVDLTIGSGDVTADGYTTYTPVDDGVSSIVTYKSRIVSPAKAYNVTSEDIEDIQGAVSYDGTTHTATFTDAYITFTVPRNAAPEVVRAAFAEQQAKLQNSLGVIIKFTQPTITSATVGTYLDGRFEVVITDGTETSTGLFDFVRATVPSNIYAIVNSTTVTIAQVQTLITYFTENEMVIGGDNDFVTDAATADWSVSSNSFTVTQYPKYNVRFAATLGVGSEAETGNFDLSIGDANGHYAMDPDTDNAGTHEFSYAEQVCMLFAKNQNLITKSGTRYQFDDADTMFNGFEFNDNFASAPNGKDQVVVVGLVDKISENLYDEREVLDAIKQLTDTIEAKAYDVTYSDYAELVVEDEMGYYLPQQLGYAYDKRTKEVSFFDQTTTYVGWANRMKGADIGIESAIYTWGDDKHYSINDAIDALKQEQKLIDSTSEISTSSFTRVFGGYKVQGNSIVSTPPLDDLSRANGGYEDYTINGQVINSLVTGQKLSSGYALENVLAALATADLDGMTGQIRIDATAQTESNRAIYVEPSDVALSNRANLYILKNVNGRALSADKNGIFEFYDKCGNKLYYQDKVFVKTATLALVVIGTMGLVFVVEKNGKKNFEKIAWMVKDHGYLTDKQAQKVVANGLIHTVSLNICDEAVDATCTVSGLKVRKIVKNVLHYEPVLYLDCLKVSTLEQATESVDARGGSGNSKLITWDYNKEITLNIEDALYTPASMAAIWGGEDFKKGVKDAKAVDRFKKYVAERNFIVPAGNSEGAPSQGDMTAQAVYYDPTTMEPYQDGTPIAVGEVYYKLTRSVAYGDNSLGKKIEISADKFPGTYRLVGETFSRHKKTGKDERFQFIIPEGKMSASDAAITLEADGDPTTFSFRFDVLRPENGHMMELIQFDVEDNVEQGDGSDMIKNTEDLNILDDAEMYRVSGSDDEIFMVGATEY